MIWRRKDPAPPWAALLEALNAIADGLHAPPTASVDTGPLEARVAELELSQSRVAAEAEALILKAKGQFDAARAAEERARRHRHASGGAEERDIDELSDDEIAAAYETAGIQLGNAGGLEAEPMQQVLPGMARPRAADRKAAALKAKWNGRAG